MTSNSEMDSILRTLSNPASYVTGEGLASKSKSIRSTVHISSEVGPPHRQESIQSSVATEGTSGRTGQESETSGGEHLVDCDFLLGRFHSSSDEEFAAAGTPNDRRRRSPFIDASSILEDVSGTTSQDHEKDDPEHHGSEEDEEHGGGNGEGGGHGRKRKKHREDAPEQRITIFALRLALIEKGASGLGTLSFLWATVVILGGFATIVNETDFWVVTLIILAESSRIFSRSHELEWQQLSVRSHESLAHRFFRAASSSFQHNVSFARAVKSKIKLYIYRKAGHQEGKSGNGDTAAGAASHPQPNLTRRPRTRRPTTKRLAAHRIEVEESKTKEQTRTWNARSLPLLPYTHHLVTTKLVSRLLYAVQVLSAVMSISLAIWRLRKQDFFYNPGNNQTKPPNITVSMNVFYILSVVEAGMFLFERIYWEYRIRVTELLQNVNDEAELGPENLVTVKQFFYEVYSQCMKGSVFDGLEMDLVSFSISWLQAEDFKQQLGGAQLLNRIVSRDDGKPRNTHFAADCLRRLGTTPGIIERLVEMLSWNSKQEQPLLSEISVIICRLVVYNRNCLRIVAIPGSIEGIINLLLPHEWPSPDQKMHDTKKVKAYLELRLNGLLILKYLCKDHRNCVRIAEAKGLLPILILFIEVRNRRAFDPTSRDKTNIEQKFFVYQLKSYRKSLQVIRLLAAATNLSGGLLRRQIADVVSGLKNLRDIIEFGDSQPELQKSTVEILFHMAMDPNVRKTMGATGGIIRNLYNLFASYDGTNSDPSAGSEDTEAQRKKTAEVRRLASEIAGKTLSRIVLQNENNCLRVVSMKSEQGEPFLKCMVRFLAKPLETQSAGPHEIGSCSAQILRSVMFYAEDRVKKQVAEDSASVVLQLIQRRIHEGRSSLYESYMGLASRIIHSVSHETYSQLFSTIISKLDLVKQLLKNLKHTPTTTKYPRIRRYCIELLIILSIKDAHEHSDKDDSFSNIFRSRNVNLTDVLQSTLDSISEVENFCLFSGLVGYTKHEEEMEELIVRAIRQLKSLEQAENSHPP